MHHLLTQKTLYVCLNFTGISISGKKMEHEIEEKYLNKKFLAIFQDINLHSAINIAAICNSHLQFAAILS